MPLSAIPQIAQIPGLQAALDAAAVAATVNAALALKAPLASPSLTGNVGIAAGVATSASHIALNIAHTFNGSGQSIFAQKIVVVDTASGPNAGFLRGELADGYPRFELRKTGSLYLDSITGLTADAPGLNLNQTWNNAAVNFTAAKVNVTNTACGSNSKLQDWQVDGVSKAWIDKYGYFYFAQGEYFRFNGSFLIPSRILAGSFLAWEGGKVSFDPGVSGGDSAIERASAGLLKFTDNAGNLRDAQARSFKQSEFMEIDDMASTPAAPAAGKARLWVENDGSGKLQLLVRFPSGAPQLIKIEP